MTALAWLLATLACAAVLACGALAVTWAAMVLEARGAKEPE